MLARSDIWEIARQPGVLTPLQLRVLELREIHHCTWNQIAYMTDRHQATVRGHYNAAVRRLHNKLAELENQKEPA